MRKLLFISVLALLLPSCEFFQEFFQDTDEEYSLIDMDNYPEWDYGIINNNDESYLLIKQDSVANEYTAYFNNQKNEGKGIALYFDKDLMLRSFITEKGLCNVYWTGSESVDVQIVTDDFNEIITDVHIPSIQESETRVVWMPIVIGVARGINVATDIASAVNIIEALFDGDIQAAAYEFSTTIIGGMIPSSEIGKLLGNLGFDGLEKLKKYLDERTRTLLLGDCQIQIESEKIAPNKYQITLSVSGYETIPEISGGEKSVVYAGLAIRKGWSHVSYSTNDHIIGGFKVKGNGVKTITYELPERSAYYAVPYLLPTRGDKYTFPNYVRHGNTLKLEYFNGCIDSFEQLSYSEDNDVVTFKCTAHATCEVVEGNRWRLYYENELGYTKFYDSRTYDHPSIGSPNSADFDFEIQMHSSDIKNGKKEIKLGLGVFSENQLLIASDPQIFTLTYDIMRINSISYKDDYFYYTSDDMGYIAYNIVANISGDTSKIDGFSSCGIYIYFKDVDEAFILEELSSGVYNNSKIETSVGLNVQNFDIDIANYYAKLTTCSFGVYVKFEDGTYYMSDDKSCDFIYDKKPSYKYLSVGHMTVSVIGSYEDENGETIKQYSATHPYSYAVNGALWIEYAQGIVEGGSWQDSDTGTQYRNPWYPNKDKEYSSTTTLTYYSSSNMHHTVYSKIVAKSGETIFSNSLVYGGSPENPTVSIGGTRALSVVVNDNNKIYSSMADVMSCGNIDGMAIPDIEKKENKIMRIDNLKIIPMDKVIP